MKKLIIFVAIVAVSVLGYFYLFVNPATRDIETVKNFRVPVPPLVGAIFTEMPKEQSSTIGNGIAKLTGIDGRAEWTSFQPDKYGGNPDIGCVQVIVDRTSDSGIKQIAKFQFLLNRSSEFVEINYFDVDGEQKNMLEAIMALQYGIL